MAELEGLVQTVFAAPQSVLAGLDSEYLVKPFYHGNDFLGTNKPQFFTNSFSRKCSDLTDFHPGLLGKIR